MTSARLILASSSPRRRDLLLQAGLRFDVMPAHIDETRREGELPAAYVERLALEKAQAIAALHPSSVVLGADTTVVLDGQILNKPNDLVDAERMLRALSGRMHQVLTGLAVVTQGAEHRHVETTTVFFADIGEGELAHYLSTGDSLDKAGAYGIQGYAARWVTRIEGDFFNVMGLPLAATVRLLDQIVPRGTINSTT
jgi:septum formation protein